MSARQYIEKERLSVLKAYFGGFLLSDHLRQVLLYPLVAFLPKGNDKIHIEYSPFITHLVITHFWVKHGHVVAPKFFQHGILQRNYRISLKIVPLFVCLI